MKCNILGTNGVEHVEIFESNRIQNALIDNYIDGKGCILEEQLDKESIKIWRRHISDLFVLSRRIVKFRVPYIELRKTPEYTALYDKIGELLLLLGEVNGYVLMRDYAMGDMLIAYSDTNTSDVELSGERIDIREIKFRLQVERYIARMLIIQNLKDEKMIIDDHNDKKIVRKFKNRHNRRVVRELGIMGISDGKNGEIHDGENNMNQPIVVGYEKDNCCDVSQITEVTDDTLYVYRGYIVCKRNHHSIEPVTAILKNLDGKDIELNAFLCRDCQKFFISYDSYKRYREFYGVILGNLFMHPGGVISDFHFDLLDESRLHLCGYSVSKKDALSDETRQAILAYCMDSGIMSKNDIIHLIDWLIKMNGARSGNFEAVGKWKNDIRFVEDYRLQMQDKHEISDIIKYSRNRYKRITPQQTNVNVSDSTAYIGKRVRHKSGSLGDGVIVDANQKNISVEFDNGKKSLFVYAAFEMGTLTIIQ